MRPAAASASCDARAFEHVHHAEEADRVAALHGVVGASDHRRGGHGWPREPGALGVAAGIRDVGEDPLLVADLLIHVVDDFAAQPVESLGQARADRHQQRHGVTHVVVGLGQELDIGRPVELAPQAPLDHRCGHQVRAVGLGSLRESFTESHAFSRIVSKIGFGAVERLEPDTVLGKDPGAARATIRGQQSVRDREWLARNQPAPHLRVVGQAEVRGSDCLGDARRAAGRGSGAEHGNRIGARFAGHQRLGDARVLNQFALHPLRRDIAAEAADEHVAQAAAYVDVAFRVDLAAVTGREGRTAVRTFITEISEHRRAADQDLAPGVERDAHVRQRAADTARSPRRGCVQAHDRSALAEAVALEDRQPDRRGALQQFRRDRGAADRDETQRGRDRPAALRRRHEHLEQLGHQDQAARLAFPDAADQPAGVQRAVAETQRPQTRQHHAGSRQQRRVDSANVLEQCRERQHAEVALDRDLARRFGQRRGDGLQVLAAEAHAFGGCRAAGGVGDLRGAGRQ